MRPWQKEQCRSIGVQAVLEECQALVSRYAEQACRSGEVRDVPHPERNKRNVAGMAINWRGAWCRSSWCSLRLGGLSDKFFELLSFKILIFGRAMFTVVRQRTDL